MGKDEPDISELAEKAKIVAEATGRDESDVMADLLDDGIVNMSNENNRKDLVTQLKEAAELITTVQAINKDVSENTVLNGGDNKTEVQIETTLEGDIVDRAIESIQRKTENIKKMIITMTPIFLLLTGGGLEALGVIDVMDGEEGDIYYDEPCFPSWGYDEYGYLDDNNLEVRYTFQDYNNCGIEHFGGHFIITLFESGDETEQVFIHNIDFIDYISVESAFRDLEEGNYHYRVEFHVVECEDGSCEHGDEYYLPTSNDYYIESVESCDAYFINEQAYILEEDAENDAVRISADVALVEGATNCDGEQFEIIWKLYQDNQVKYEHQIWEGGVVMDSDGADYTFHTWDAVEPGNYDPKAVLILNGDILDEKWIAHSISIEQPIYGCTDSVATNYDSMATDDDGSCEYPPEEPCEVGIHNHYRGHVGEDAEQDAILIAFKVVPTNCEGKNIFVEIDLFQNGYAENYTHDITLTGDSDSDVSHTFDGVAVGNSWIPRITATVDGEQKEQVMFWGIDVVAPEPEACEINLYYIMLGTNSTHATVAYDLDCGYQENELEGYNVSVQFLAYEVGSENNTSSQPIVWDTTLNYVQGWEYDNNSLTLTNFTSNNTTHYDFYWYATWIDADGDMKFIERKWLNREL